MMSLIFNILISHNITLCMEDELGYKCFGESELIYQICHQSFSQPFCTMWYSYILTTNEILHQWLLYRSSTRKISKNYSVCKGYLLIYYGYLMGFKLLFTSNRLSKYIFSVASAKPIRNSS